jgi:hypothetical protein
MGGVRPGTTLALLACALGAAWGIATLGAGCSSPEPNPPLQQDCAEPGCLSPKFNPGPPQSAFIAQGSTPPEQDAGVADAEVVTADGAGVPSAGPGPGIVGNETAVGTGNTNELGPVCPLTAPTNGAPCAPAVNTIACIYSVETCFCTTSWVCF